MRHSHSCFKLRHWCSNTADTKGSTLHLSFIMRESRSTKGCVKMREPHFTSEKWDPRSASGCTRMWPSRFTLETRDPCSDIGRSHSHEARVSSSIAPTADLRDYLTRKKSIHQITPQCCYKWLITAVLSEHHCSSYTSKLSVFNQLSAASASNSAKRRLSCKKKLLWCWIPGGDFQHSMSEHHTNSKRKQSQFWRVGCWMFPELKRNTNWARRDLPMHTDLS